MANRFVIHEHWASHHHYDLRIERNGYLADWAVPKGVPKTAGKKVLAIKQPNHELKWLNFQGEIKDGYGAGKIKIWDKGTYDVLKWKRDRIVINLKGNKVKGVYVLFNFKDKQWWLFKAKKSVEELKESTNLETTLLVIKPDALSHTADILNAIKGMGSIQILYRGKLPLAFWKEFYSIHKGKPYYNSLVKHMSSGPVVIVEIVGPNAIKNLRKLIGSFDPSKAEPNTLRALFGKSSLKNAVHASDSPISAKKEIELVKKFLEGSD